MIRPTAGLAVVALVALSALLSMTGVAAAQTPLTLQDALARARAQNPEAAGTRAAEREAEHRVTQARAGYLPRVDVVESWQRGNQPVFVFGSLLGQRQFTAADFALEALNHPDATDNFRTALMVEQSLFNGATTAGLAAAEVGRDMAAARRSMVGSALAADVTAAYGRALAAAAMRRAAAGAVEAAGADRELAANRRDAGLVTDADVLQTDVHVSRARERQIHAAAQDHIARLRLNELMGEPLDAVFVLEDAAAGPSVDPGALATLEEEALAHRPDVRLAALEEQLAATARTAARAAFLPQVAVQGGWELNGGTWTSRESSWAVGLVARVNVFNGLSDRARLAEAREQATRRTFEREKTQTAVRLDVRVALARLEAARASEVVGRAAVEQARESQRIIRDRYEAGLTDVASLLRAADAVAQADAQQIAAQATILIETAALERTLGRQ